MVRQHNWLLFFFVSSLKMTATILCQTETVNFNKFLTIVIVLFRNGIDSDFVMILIVIIVTISIIMISVDFCITTFLLDFGCISWLLNFCGVCVMKQFFVVFVSDFIRTSTLVITTLKISKFPNHLLRFSIYTNVIH